MTDEFCLVLLLFVFQYVCQLTVPTLAALIYLQPNRLDNPDTKTMTKMPNTDLFFNKL